MDELDEFNEAPHIVRERERRQNSLDNGIVEVITSHHSNNNHSIAIRTNATANAVSDEIVNPGNEGSTNLLHNEELEADLLTDLNKNSHIVA